MRLSPLQRYILGVCFNAKKKVSRVLFDKHHINKGRKRKDAVDAVTKSLVNLVDKGLLVGYGVRTPKKWYIKEIRLTSLGRKIAKQLSDKRQRLPLK